MHSALFKAEAERIRMACLAERLAAEAGSDSQRAPLLVAEKALAGGDDRGDRLLLGVQRLRAKRSRKDPGWLAIIVDGYRWVSRRDGHPTPPRASTH